MYFYCLIFFYALTFLLLSMFSSILKQQFSYLVPLVQVLLLIFCSLTDSAILVREEIRVKIDLSCNFSCKILVSESSLLLTVSISFNFSKISFILALGFTL
jgi:hypothetical protein